MTVKTSSELFLLTTTHFEINLKATNTVATTAKTRVTSKTTVARLCIGVCPSLISHRRGDVWREDVILDMNMTCTVSRLGVVKSDDSVYSNY